MLEEHLLVADVAVSGLYASSATITAKRMRDIREQQLGMHRRGETRVLLMDGICR